MFHLWEESKIIGGTPGPVRMAFQPVGTGLIQASVLCECSSVPGLAVLRKQLWTEAPRLSGVQGGMIMEVLSGPFPAQEWLGTPATPGQPCREQRDRT